jgi:uncharacterized membrane protein
MLLGADDGVDFGGLFKWSFVLMVLVLILWVAVSTIRKRLKEDDPTVGTGFTLSDLRQLHKQGKMSTEEFEKAKAILLASLAKDPAPPTTETRPPPDIEPRG